MHNRNAGALIDPVQQEIAIRHANRFDAARIASVYVETWQSTYAGILPDEALVRMSVSRQTRQWQGHLTRGDSTLVAEDKKSGVVGFGSFGRNRDRQLPYDGEVFTLYILPDFQGLGIGKRLLHRAFSSLKELGHKSAIIWVLALNPSRFFYEAQGGEKIAERTEFLFGANLREFGYGWAAI